MTRLSRFLPILGLVLVTGLFLATVPALAGDGVPMPKLAKAQGENCVEPVDFMRRNHMDLLKHKRDETVHDGIRIANKKYSWTGCVNCHAATHPDVAGDKVRTLYPFCYQCHEYAAVTIDCVQCHSAVPQDGKSAGGPKDGEAAKLLSMIKGHLDGSTGQ